MKVRFGQSEKFTKNPRITNDSQHFTRGAMATEPAPAPIASSICQIDFTNDAFSDQACRIRRNHFPNEFVPRYSPESVVTAKELNVGVTYAAEKQSDQSVSPRSARLRQLTYVDATVFEMDSQHGR